MKKSLTLFALTVVSVLMLSSFSACTTKPERQQSADEVEGARLLVDARRELSAKHYDSARDSIISLRQHYPLAMDARKQAILLLDSIELLAARDSFDALNRLAQQQYMQSLDNPDAPLQLDSATYVDEHERLDIKVQFFERKLEEDWKSQRR